ncbi:MAG: S-layer homology domain-containing protein [Actinomycetota bacterium]
MHFTKTKLALAIIAIVVAGSSAAFAGSVFSDVDDDRFYADAAAWAKDNGITFGCGDGTTFCPDDPVTRGENITFAKRYDDNIVQPALQEINDDMDAMITVVAYANIMDDGTVEVAHSSGITDAHVAREAISAFCFYDLPFEFSTVQVTPRYEGNDEHATAEVAWPGAPDLLVGLDCGGADLDLEVATLEGGTWAPHGFTIVFFG